MIEISSDFYGGLRLEAIHERNSLDRARPNAKSATGGNDRRTAFLKKDRPWVKLTFLD